MLTLGRLRVLRWGKLRILRRRLESRRWRDGSADQPKAVAAADQTVPESAPAQPAAEAATLVAKLVVGPGVKLKCAEIDGRFSGELTAT